MEWLWLYNVLSGVLLFTCMVRLEWLERYLRIGKQRNDETYTEL